MSMLISKTEAKFKLVVHFDNIYYYLTFIFRYTSLNEGTIKINSIGVIVLKKTDTEVFVDCPVAGVQKIVRGKWNMVILYFLHQQTLRFGELSRKLPTVTQAQLTKELRMLESYGLINRKVYPQVPPKVEYSLTKMGEQFMPVLDALEKFADVYEAEQE